MYTHVCMRGMSSTALIIIPLKEMGDMILTENTSLSSWLKEFSNRVPLQLSSF